MSIFDLLVKVLHWEVRRMEKRHNEMYKKTTAEYAKADAAEEAINKKIDELKQYAIDKREKAEKVIDTYRETATAAIDVKIKATAAIKAIKDL